MKNTGTCPKCGSTNILRFDGQVGAERVGSIKVDHYFCGDCGYSEQWIDPEFLPRWVKKFKK